MVDYYEFGFNAETDEGLKHNWRVDVGLDIARLRGGSPSVRAETEELFGLGSTVYLERAIVRACSLPMADPHVDVIHAKGRVFAGDSAYTFVFDSERCLFDYTDGLVGDRNAGRLLSHIKALVGDWFRPRIPQVVR